MSTQRALPRLFCIAALALLGACVQQPQQPQQQPTTPPAGQPQAPATAPQDQQAAEFERIRQQAMRGDLDSQYQLGSLYFVGKPQKDLKQAEYWWKQAADKGHSQSAFSLAFLYTGRADPAFADQRAMHKYLNQASAAGNAMAQHVLGSMYAQGAEGLKRDPYQARALFQSACDKQYAPSCEALKKLQAN
ncbi:sel1 repeat family protein [Pseudomonas sp. BN411]|uniref:tetratricopeptide repeat protein n=1 Tax=Pseudomonas sp. BN411 TaxID=2567887 RepID=UPI00245609CE|nr:sel1 repeat family protein [Pseudomonas sp. BN411]MDH4560838.1 sel1 repeat family protein [Pseudomonas sp. BN411]